MQVRIWELTSVLKKKMKNKFLLVFLLLLIFFKFSHSQQKNNQYSILFYNVENLFDIHDDPATEDDNFTPDGDYHWTSKRLSVKLLSLSKVILNASEWNVPDIVVFCEVENRNLLERLISQTPLKSYPYKIIHKESPDFRGIDVAMIYNSETFYPVEYQYYPLILNGKQLNTRDILYVSGILNGKDTIHIFGNHWPSRYSGLMETRELRNAAASLLRSKVDELNQKFKSPKIVIVGDFNDNPDDFAISQILLANDVQNTLEGNKLYNLFWGINRTDQGSLKFQSQWFIFDQIIVSGSLLNGSGVFTKPENAKILTLPFLLEDDQKFGGQKPFRTYYGFTYNGGFSDHLPVIIKLNYAN